MACRLDDMTCKSSEMGRFNRVTHVIFDMDGLLLDSEDIYYKIFSAIANAYKKEYSWDVKLKLLGRSEKDSAKVMVEELKLPITPEKFLEEQTLRQASLLPDTPLMPGADQLVRHLHSKGVPIAIATSSSRESVDLKTTNHKDLFGLFHHLVSGSSDPEVKRGKPAPDIFQVCAAKFPENPPPEKVVLVFEDAPNGVLAAVAAGMQVVMVPDENISEEKRRPATLVLKSLNDFRPELFGLPPRK